MPSLRFKLVSGILLGLLVIAVAFTLTLGRAQRAPAPPSEPHPVTTSEPAAPGSSPNPPPATIERPSRSKGQSDWIFFFRAGDTLSRMSDGTALGVIVRVERAYAFPDGPGPAYVVRSPDRRETVFDADQLERSARVESTREIARPPIATPAR